MSKIDSVNSTTVSRSDASTANTRESVNRAAETFDRESAD
jgi:hypothetical protein